MKQSVNTKYVQMTFLNVYEFLHLVSPVKNNKKGKSNTQYKIANYYILKYFKSAKKLTSYEMHYSWYN